MARNTSTPPDLPRNGWRIMNHLYPGKALTAERISKDLWSSQYTGSKSVPAQNVELERMGFVLVTGEKLNDLRNRVEVYSLTPKGRALIEMGPAGLNLLNEMFATLGRLNKARAVDLAPRKMWWDARIRQRLLDYEVPGYDPDTTQKGN